MRFYQRWGESGRLGDESSRAFFFSFFLGGVLVSIFSLLYNQGRIINLVVGKVGEPTLYINHSAVILKRFDQHILRCTSFCDKSN